MNETISTVWNSSVKRVETKAQKTLGCIVLAEQQCSPGSNDDVHAALLEGVKTLGLAVLNWSKEAEAFRQRVNFVNLQKIQQCQLPELDDHYLLNNLDEWLAPHLSGQNSVKQLQKLDLHTILQSCLTWPQQQQLKQWVPTHITVPSGSKVAIDYTVAQTPVLAVRLQEVFGLQDSPTILDGQVTLTMHLLSPARKPMQITQDLRSFWQTTYHDVKKELKGKYKRHYWPDDPFTAIATNKTKRNM